MANLTAASAHPDHSRLLPRLKRARGQLQAIERMVDERRYCVDILIQLKAAMAALRAVEASLFEAHLKHCVSGALHARDRKQIEAKVRELTSLLSRRTTVG